MKFAKNGAVVLCRGVSLTFVLWGISVLPAQAAGTSEPLEVHPQRTTMKQILTYEQAGKLSGRRLELKSRFGLGFGSAESEESESNVAGLVVTTLGNYRFTESFRSLIELRLSMLTERSQFAVGDDEFENGLRLKNATLDWVPTPNIEIAAGAIRQGRVVPSDLLIRRSGVFPGAMQKFRFGNGIIGLEVMAEQAIPSSRSLDTERQEKEAMPSFFMEKAALDFTPNGHLQLKPYVGYYQFNDLPSKVAFESSTRGNTVDESFASSARFTYEFEGLMLGAEGLLHFSDRLNLVAYYNEIQNSKAPNAFNTGRELGVDLSWNTGPIVWIPQYKVYFNESDASPAYYNSADMGNSNVEGQSAGMEIIFPAYWFKVDLEYFDNKLINPKLNQRDRKHFVVFVETLNVEF